MIFECFQIPKTTVFVNHGILVVEAAILSGILCSISDKTGSRNIFDVYLNTLAWILHLFVRFCNVFWIRKFYRLLITPPQNPVEAGYRALVASLP